MQNAIATTPTEILCRLDTAKRAPVLFFPETIKDGQMLSWMDGQQLLMPLEYYHMTAPMSAADEKVMAERWAAAARIAVADVRIRHRLPRVPRDRSSIVANNAPALSLAVNNTAPAPQAAQQPPVSTPQLLAGLTPEAMAALAQVAAQLAPVTQQQVAPAVQQEPATNTRRTRKGSGHAKPIEAQQQDNAGGMQVEAGLTLVAPETKAPAGMDKPQEPIPGTVAQATPAEVMAAVAKLGEEFNGKLNQLLAALTPAVN